MQVHSLPEMRRSLAQVEEFQVLAKFKMGLESTSLCVLLNVDMKLSTQPRPCCHRQAAGKPCLLVRKASVGMMTDRTARIKLLDCLARLSRALHVAFLHDCASGLAPLAISSTPDLSLADRR